MFEQRKLVLDILNNLKIDYDILEHPNVFTMEEMNSLDLDPKNEIVKNLFLCDDKKKRFILLVLSKGKIINLKNLKDILNSRPLSFANEERLNHYLGLNKGSVTPFGILNDKECIVEVIFDEDIKSFKRMGVHPNDNSATVFLEPKNLVKIIKDHGNKISYLNLN